MLDSGQQKGIIGLTLIILILIGLIYGLRNRSSEPIRFSVAVQEEEMIQHYIDSMRSVYRQKRIENPPVQPFNPNFITDYRGYVLGLSTEEIDRLLDYRQQGKWINSSIEFQEVTKVSDSLLNRISAFFKFPEWVNEEPLKAKTRDDKAPFEVPLKDLNKATATDLENIPGLGSKLAGRIIRYRTLLGGFVDEIQLKNVYGLSEKRRQTLLTHFTVQPKSNFRKLNVNTVGVAELTEIYYIDYELARKIVNYRITHNGISDLEELNRIEGFPQKNFQQIKLYLTVDPVD